MLATFGALLVQPNVATATVFPLASTAVAENDCACVGEMTAVLGMILIAAVGPIFTVEELPPQLPRNNPAASRHINATAR